MFGPDNKRAAVSLTYDDGTDAHLDIVIPDLDSAGLCGTFFLTFDRPGVYDRKADWRAAWKSGRHELGNHTWTHPHGDDLRVSDEETFYVREIEEAENWLDRHIGEDVQRTFAYPDGNQLLGAGTPIDAQDRYERVLRRKFVAARGNHAELVTPEAARRNPYLINAAALTWGDDRSAPVIDFCARALRDGAWAVLIFHDVVDGEAKTARETSRRVHNEILHWLVSRKSDLYIAPFRQVYLAITAEYVA
jgi:peptidoglycan/xylan/chitin deacetylase (PgdA/CDA1 family)